MGLVSQSALDARCPMGRGRPNHRAAPGEQEQGPPCRRPQFQCVAPLTYAGGQLSIHEAGLGLDCFVLPPQAEGAPYCTFPNHRQRQEEGRRQRKKRPTTGGGMRPNNGTTWDGHNPTTARLSPSTPNCPSTKMKEEIDVGRQWAQWRTTELRHAVGISSSGISVRPRRGSLTELVSNCSVMATIGQCEHRAVEPRDCVSPRLPAHPRRRPQCQCQCKYLRYDDEDDEDDDEGLRLYSTVM